MWHDVACGCLRNFMRDHQIPAQEWKEKYSIECERRRKLLVENCSCQGVVHVVPIFFAGWCPWQNKIWGVLKMNDPHVTIGFNTKIV